MNIHPSIIHDLARLPFAENLLRRWYTDAPLIKWFLDEIWDARESEDFPGYRSITEEEFNLGLHESLWKPIPHWPEYEAHPLGYVRNAERKSINAAPLDDKGYPALILSRTVDGERVIRNFKLHQLIAMTFIPDFEPAYYLAVIHHRDHNKKNNSVWNLRVMDPSKHMEHHFGKRKL